MMDFSFGILFTSLIAGITTVFAPCIFLFLPIVLGASNTGAKRNFVKPLTIILSLAVSVFVFTILLKATTTLINIHPSVWEVIAGGIIFIQGVIVLFPELWDWFSSRLGLSSVSNKALESGRKRQGFLGDILVGAALGPIFSSCSPTYGFIVGAVFQANPSVSLIYLTVYIIGLCLMLGAVALGGQALVQRMKWGLNPHGVFKRVLALVFIILGWSIMFGIHREVETFIVQRLEILDVTKLEGRLLKEQI